jgi:hypothetical protein
MTQRCVALSTAEAELIALTLGTKEAVWLHRMINELGTQIEQLTIFEDNQSAIILTANNKFSERTKHMSTRYFFVREKIRDGTIKVEYVSTENQLADIFTKPLQRIAFQRLRSKLGLQACD